MSTESIIIMVTVIVCYTFHNILLVVQRKSEMKERDIHISIIITLFSDVVALLSLIFGWDCSLFANPLLIVCIIYWYIILPKKKAINLIFAMVSAWCDVLCTGLNMFDKELWNFGSGIASFTISFILGALMIAFVFKLIYEKEKGRNMQMR